MMLALLFVEEGLGSDEGFGRAFFKDLIRGERLEDFGQLSEFGLVAFFLPLGAEDADFLEVLDAFGEFGETDAATATGIDHEAVTGRPGAETSVSERIQGPAVVGPAEVTVIVLGLDRKSVV